MFRPNVDPLRAFVTVPMLSLVRTVSIGHLCSTIIKCTSNKETMARKTFLRNNIMYTSHNNEIQFLFIKASRETYLLTIFGDFRESTCRTRKCRHAHIYKQV